MKMMCGKSMRRIGGAQVAKQLRNLVPVSAFSNRPNGSDRMVALQDLMQETIKIAVSSGPAGVSRGLQAMRAFFEIGQETLISGKLDSPPVILRSLFEKLGQLNSGAKSCGPRRVT